MRAAHANLFSFPSFPVSVRTPMRTVFGERTWLSATHKHTLGSKHNCTRGYGAALWAGSLCAGTRPTTTGACATMVIFLRSQPYIAPHLNRPNTPGQSLLACYMRKWLAFRKPRAGLAHLISPLASLPPCSLLFQVIKFPFAADRWAVPMAAVSSGFEHKEQAAPGFCTADLTWNLCECESESASPPSHLVGCWLYYVTHTNAHRRQAHNWELCA